MALFFAHQENERAGTNRITSVLNMGTYRGHCYLEDEVTRLS